MHPTHARAFARGLRQLLLWTVSATVSSSAAMPGLSEPAATPSILGPQLPLAFYDRRGGFVAMSADLTARFAPDRVLIVADGRHVTLGFRGLPGKARAPQGEQLQPGHGNFLFGDKPRDWESDVAIYGALRYRELYAGVDLLYRGESGQLKADWIVAPGAAPGRIAWEYPEARRVLVDEDGSLVIELESGVMREHRPVAYQETGGARHAVEASYRLTKRGDGFEVGFVVGDYDHSLPLVIDPALSYSSYLGGTRNDVATAMALDTAGTIFVAGYTESGNAPQASPALPYQGSVEAYVFHFNAGATQLLYATFIGGNGDDRAYGIDIDPSGNAYVAGSTASSNFPKASPLQFNLSGARDVFFLKLSAAGNALLYSTYFGGTDSETAYGVDVDNFGQLYVAGETGSTNFPTKLPYQAALRGGTDAFVFKINANGALVFSTYIGGTANDGARGVAISNNQLTPYLTGYTWSTDFPVWSPAQGFNGGGQDAFMVRFNGDANGLVFSTYLGGTGGSVTQPEMGMAITVDQFNNVYAAGVTSSTNFPLKTPYQSTLAGGQDAWLRKIDSGGSLVYSTYLGGVNADTATAIRVDSLLRPYVAGYTNSANFPVLQSPQAGLGGGYDAFVTVFQDTGTALVSSSLLGGSSNDAAYGVAADLTTGITYLTGSTGSSNFPTQAAFRFVNTGVLDAFVAKLTPTAPPATRPAFLGVTPNVGTGSSVTFTVQVADVNGANDMDSAQMLIRQTFTGVNSCHMAYVPATNLFYLLNNAGSAFVGGLPGGTPTILTNSQCSLNLTTAQATKLGNLITLVLPMTFTAAYSGQKQLYLMAVDKGGLRADWASYGFWTVP